LLGLAVLPVVVNGSHCVKNELRWKRTRSSGHRAASAASAGTGANTIQLAHDGRPACAMNGAIHSAPSAQTGVRRIDNSVDADFGDIPDHQAELLSVREIDLHF
jgi:hypothetical protein